MDIDGNLVWGNSREYVWLPDIIAEGLPPSIRVPDLIPQIKINSEFDRSIVKRLFDVKRHVFQHNYHAACILVSSMILMLHYSFVISCAIVAAYGPSKTGKSTALKIALSQLRLRHNSI
uniref:Uncharacterized protein n=1 Tax=Amphimedon queenslandica TaxID=400682 RepID=A0A1X7VKQ8_AMPQE